MSDKDNGIYYIITTLCVCVCVSVFYLSFTYFFFSDVISLSLLLWRNPIGSHSLWTVLGGGRRESPVKHGAVGASRGGSTGGGDQQRGPAWAEGGHGRGRTGWGRGGRGRGGRAGGDLHLIKQKYKFFLKLFSL
jgi:hypothetical protein